MSDTNNNAPVGSPGNESVEQSVGTSASGFGKVAPSSLNEGGQSEGQQAAQAAERAVPEATRRYKLKVDGQDVDVDEAEVIKRAQLGSSATKRFEEVKAERAKISQLREIFKKDALAALQDPALGLTKDQIREQFEQWYRREYIEPATMSPEQLELRDLRSREASYKQQQELGKQAEEQTKQEAETRQWAQHWQQQIVTAAKAGDLPESEDAISAVAGHIKAAREAGINMPVEVAVSQVKQQLAFTAKRLMSKMDGEQLIKFVGEDVINSIRKADLARLRGGQPQSGLAKQPTSQNNPFDPNRINRGGKKPVAMNDVRDYFDKLKE